MTSSLSLRDGRPIANVVHVMHTRYMNTTQIAATDVTTGDMLIIEGIAFIVRRTLKTTRSIILISNRGEHVAAHADMLTRCDR